MSLPIALKAELGAAGMMDRSTVLCQPSALVAEVRFGYLQ